MSYHPDDDGGELADLQGSVKRCVHCGSEDDHRPLCPYYDDDALAVDADDTEDGEPDDEADELFED